ncbi:16S rRNA (uracil(1498)-N(3))-methyltransferase [Microbacterium sp. NIBRBAC000506063]|uniref:16S rRNA (uracil(1498)-N(3))-methyltransferase n=1 Tax=Microbacterium sp. NIBRBAC000506063 TaxID=2734618 RepID=UPI001BB71ABC|nr:16S rRNA (uracil(1498)-N(3))-methyltransferase [Microbacterium sp. NIBRBAC000506063]QTV80781.1 16S rRNA (uracil(1498)-N(3))-methyltransferase [Microbacterium sp. NIBRBAC000506063]
MALHFLTPDAAAAAVGDSVALTGGEAKHAAVVRRLRVGEAVTLGDGAGTWLEGTAEEVAPSHVDIRIIARAVHPKPARRIVLVQALAKGDRDELAVQAACELGVDEVVPWQAARSVSRWQGPKAVKGRERWESIVREAAKQAHRAWVPEVSAPVTTAQLRQRAEAQRLLVLEPTASDRLSEVVADDRDIVLVVGPEGGISPEELAQFDEAGAERVRLGDTVLRTSTAGPAAIALLSAALGRW